MTIGHETATWEPCSYNEAAEAFASGRPVQCKLHGSEWGDVFPEILKSLARESFAYRRMVANGA